MAQAKPQSFPIHRLPLPSATLQRSLPQLELDPKPSAQRRSNTFPPSTPGVWARVNPLWTGWPLRLSNEEAEEMGLKDGDQVSVEDVLKRWDPVDVDAPADLGGDLEVKTSQRRLQVKADLLGVSQSALAASLPHLDIGDPIEPGSSAEAREMLVDVVSGRKVLASSDGSYGPWSTRYCGHQFGSWAGQLGDGRAISLLETESEAGGRQEIQTKGSGRTPFSRTADGLAVLRSGVREYLGCEAIAALGIPTTRALALLTSSSTRVMRENGAEPSSLLARVAPSFIRIGHFEALNPGEVARRMQTLFFGGGGWVNDQSGEGGEDGPLGGQGNLEGLAKLYRWVQTVEPVQGGIKEWVKEVVRKNAETVAQWQVYGFMHGVLNTDNISVLGLTIDYGPYAFMDVWDEKHICNHSDPSGLYSYKAQPGRVLFALDSLVHSLLPLIGYESVHGPLGEGSETALSKAGKDDVRAWEEEGLKVMEGWEKAFWETERATERSGWLKRFGLRTSRDSDDRDIIFDFLVTLHAQSLDFHGSFRKLCSFTPSTPVGPFSASLVDECSTDLRADSKRLAAEEVGRWLKVYAARLGEEVKDGDEDKEGEWGKEMRKVNPRFVLRQWVLEEVIGEMETALGKEDLKSARKALNTVLKMATSPFEEYAEGEEARLCGLGAKDMLGFQCSCSS